MAAEIPYPDILEYPWMKDFARVKANSKYKKFFSEYSDLPKAPINLVLTVMKETMERPEIMAAFASTIGDENFDHERNHITLFWYREYIKHKYGNYPDPYLEMDVAIRKLAQGVYSGLDDPNMIAALMARRHVGPDDGVDYGIVG